MRKSLFFLFLLNCSVCIAQQSKSRTFLNPSPKTQSLTFTTTTEQPPSIDSLFIVDKIVLSEATEDIGQGGGVWAEQMPEFPGGIKGMNAFIKKNLMYPEVAKKAKVEGVVYVSFIVNAEGAIDEVKVMKGIGYGCDEEAKRLIHFMPKWIPARQNGRNIAVRYSLPIRFSFPKEKK
ncbi:energy transducer TonB [Xanthocytophaga agilis]|uniref:Energy transducer TonB n=1 Tax=Xanthocytophaga agilis TaxID=3048010 RepID=A0AAE3R837_9BACT|nr:energy transducer TonB [Xanthocytophaga agilis]MDJ1503140.1 energy transducer TonB [Xanthocytophaga agilis]